LIKNTKAAGTKNMPVAFLLEYGLKRHGQDTASTNRRNDDNLILALPVAAVATADRFAIAGTEQRDVEIGKSLCRAAIY
jgi:ABC-type lipopolysaccharide export system ATPase subunit